MVIAVLKKNFCHLNLFSPVPFFIQTLSYSQLHTKTSKVILVASIVLFGAYAVSSDKQGLLEETKDSNAALARSDREVPADYEPLGCFDWKNMKKQKLIGKVKPFLEKVKTKLSAKALESCIGVAKRKSIQLFGIQKKKGKILCLEGEDERWNGNVKVSHTCKDNIGTGKSIFIYRKSPIAGINSKNCRSGDNLIANGAQKDIYYASSNDCKTCRCSGGVLTCTIKYYCHSDPHCAIPPGECCPYCQPSACSEGRKPGDFWFKRVNADSCFYCRCLYGDIERCEKVLSFSCPPLNCENPVAHSKSCCLKCEASTQRVYSIKNRPTTEMELPWYS